MTCDICNVQSNISNSSRFIMYFLSLRRSRRLTKPVVLKIYRLPEKHRDILFTTQKVIISSMIISDHLQTFVTKPYRRLVEPNTKIRKATKHFCCCRYQIFVVNRTVRGPRRDETLSFEVCARQWLTPT